MPVKIDTIKTAVDIASTLVNAGVALADARRRVREEQEKRAANEKDRRIRELETENAALKAAASLRAKD